MVKIVKQWDKLKPSIVDSYFGVESVTDQRAILNSPQGAVEAFLLDGVEEELEKETIADFENDIHDYNERAEFGEDVATARRVEMTAVKEKALKALLKPKKSAS